MDDFTSNFSIIDEDDQETLLKSIIKDKGYNLKPKEVTGLNNIKDIGVGYYHVVAVDDNGEVYTWGLNNNGQLGSGNTDNKREPIKVNGLSNIVKVDAYKYITTALDSNGNLYAWGESFGNVPKKLYENVIDIRDNAYITKDKRVGLIGGNLIHNIRNAVKVSSGDTGLLVVLDNGQVIKVDTS